MHLLPQAEWQAAPADAAQDDDVDESDAEEPEDPADAAASNRSGAQPALSSTEPFDGPMQQLQLHRKVPSVLSAALGAMFPEQKLLPHHTHLCVFPTLRCMVSPPLDAVTGPLPERSSRGPQYWATCCEPNITDLSFRCTDTI